MSPDDARHGTNAGYVAGCRQTCCKDAAARYERGISWDHMNGRYRKVPIIGARRRVEALQALGWALEDLSRHMGMSRAWLHVTINANKSGLIYRRNHDRIAALYDELSMTLPPESRCIVRQRNAARRKGLYPPLAWDDGSIDDPAARPRRGSSRPARKSDVDPVVVDRLIAGEHVKATQAERNEAMRRWLAMGRSEKSLCEMHGWKDGRYGRAA
jgi:hypothetical protein